MTDRELYKQTFAALHASGKIDLEANVKKYNMKRLIAVCVCVVLALALSVTAYAAGRQIFGWGGNFVITESDSGREAILFTDRLTDPVLTENGRMYFIVNGEHIDITDEVSEQNAFTYQYPDSDGLIHYWMIGLNSDEPGNWGYAEYIKDPQTGEWKGGYSARVNTNEDGSTVPWLDIGKITIGIPW